MELYAALVLLRLQSPTVRFRAETSSLVRFADTLPVQPGRWVTFQPGDMGYSFHALF